MTKSDKMRHYCGIFYVRCWKIRAEKRDRRPGHGTPAKPFLDQQYNWTAVFSDMPLQKDS